MRKINWSEYNELLIRRGEMLFDDGFLKNWRAELKRMNKGKECANYRYPEFPDVATTARLSTRVSTSINTVN